MAKTTIATQDLKQERNATAEGADAFVFLDQRGKRWPRFKRYLLLVAVVGLLGLLVFLKTLLVPSDLEAPPAAEQIRTRLMALTLPGQADQTVTKPLWRNFARGDEGGNGAMAHDKGPGAQAHFPDKDRSQDGAAEIRLGFYESWDSASLTSLKAHAAQLTHLAPDWLTFEDGQGEIKVNAADDLIDLAHEDGLALVPLLRNMDTNQVWQPEAVETLLNGPSSGQDRFTTNLVTRLQELGAAGVLIDWQEIDPYYKNALSGFLARIAIGLHAEGLELWLSVPARRQLVLLDLEYLAAHVDHFVANLYDENAELGPAGPVASQDFFSGWLDTLVKGYGTPAQWIIGIGSYGYDWQEGDAEAELISFEDAMVRASSSQQASLTLEAPFFNPHYAYRDQNAVHEIWFLDAVTFMNQLAESRDHQVGGIAVFRLGTEDPDIWHLLDLDLTRPLSPTDLAELELISPGEAMAHVGQGSLLTIKDHRADGLRRLSLDQGTGGQLPASARYEKFPGYLSLIHEGVGPKDAVTITFDDGPDPEWTPALLDILKAEGVQATFFLIGANMERHPDLVRRIVQEGHMIGVHTFTHPNLAEVSEERASLELNATQRLIESITGQSTILFRPPYNADYNPDSPEEVVPIQIAQRLGYLTVTMDIDPEDWDKPGVETMLERVRTGRRQGGSVVLLHDAGGDRAQTVEVLPQIIHYLRARGDTILPLPAILGIPAAQLMPKVPEHDQPVLRMISESGFEVIRILSNLLWGLLILATVLTLCKTLVVSGLALRSRRAERLARAASGWPPAKCPPEECPPVSVLVAAYNEAKVIRQTLLTVLSTRYPGPLEVIVVDDGSVDGTGDIVMALARQDERVRLIRQPNRGKARALSNGLNQARHAIIVSLDADTQFQPDTISELVRPFTNPCAPWPQPKGGDSQQGQGDGGAEKTAPPPRRPARADRTGTRECHHG